MQVIETGRGFEVLEHEVYPPETPPRRARLAQQSSAVGEYDDAMGRPGTSFLWVGQGHHLDREEVRQLVGHLENWLRTGRLGGETG